MLGVGALFIELSINMKIEENIELKFSKRDNTWEGKIKTIYSEIPVDVFLEVENEHENINEQVKIITTFFNEYEDFSPSFYQLIFKQYSESTFQKSIEEIRRMYFLSSVGLKKDNITCWVVLEPSFEVASIYNHFMRFTVHNKEVVWSNI